MCNKISETAKFIFIIVIDFTKFIDWMILVFLVAKYEWWSLFQCLRLVSGGREGYKYSLYYFLLVE